MSVVRRRAECELRSIGSGRSLGGRWGRGRVRCKRWASSLDSPGSRFGRDSLFSADGSKSPPAVGQRSRRVPPGVPSGAAGVRQSRGDKFYVCLWTRGPGFPRFPPSSLTGRRSLHSRADFSVLGQPAASPASGEGGTYPRLKESKKVEEERRKLTQASIQGHPANRGSQRRGPGTPPLRGA